MLRHKRSIFLSVIGSQVLLCSQFVFAGSLSVSPQMLAGPPVGHGSYSAPSSQTGVNPSWLKKPTLTIVGNLPVTKKTSFGTMVPLSDALKLIIPDGWQVYAKKGVSGSFKVSWNSKDKPWTDALKTVLGQSGMDGTIHAEQMALVLNVKPVKKIKPLHLIGYSKWSSHYGNSKSASGKSWVPGGTLTVWGKNGAESATHSKWEKGPYVDTVVSPAAHVAPVANVTLFTANKGEMLSQALRVFLRKKGWHLAWNDSEDWPIKYSFVLSGSKKSVSNQLMRLYPVKITGYVVNHTVSVTSVGN